MAGDFRPSFVKVYQDAGEVIRKGIAAYVQEVKERSFPAENHVTHLKDELIHELYGSSEGETNQ